MRSRLRIRDHHRPSGGLTGVPFDPLYATAEHTLIGLVRSAAHGMAGRGVRLQAVCPGMIGTPMLGRAAVGYRFTGIPGHA
ncbi:SDR family oxidoreductase [Streptomyces werraensis]|uniref:SDR family oxidoreductase n=1 Tax=Streptomyces werraensis TaxID=68284 RepID=A0ABV3JT02_9ACTN